MTSNSSTRLYTRLIRILKILQVIGYFIVLFYCLLLFIISSVIGGTSSFGLAANLAVWWGLFSALIACAVIYITTQVSIAIVDLLSRIERNTRPE